MDGHRHDGTDDPPPDPEPEMVRGAGQGKVYREPSVIDTFMEAYDFGGKTVVPFATSGGSDMGDSAANLQTLAAGAKIAAGRRFDANTPADKLADWAKQWL